MAEAAYLLGVYALTMIVFLTVWALDYLSGGLFSAMLVSAAVLGLVTVRYRGRRYGDQ